MADSSLLVFWVTSIYLLDMIQSGTLLTLLGRLITSPFTNERSIFIIVEFKMTFFIGRVKHMSWNAYDTQICVGSSAHTQICVSYAFL